MIVSHIDGDFYLHNLMWIPRQARKAFTHFIPAIFTVFSLEIAACDDAKIRVWRVPDGGLTETLTEPESYLKGINPEGEILGLF